MSKWELGQPCPDFQGLVLLSDYYEMGLDELVKGIDVGDVRALDEPEKQIPSIYSNVEGGGDERAVPNAADRRLGRPRVSRLRRIQGSFRGGAELSGGLRGTEITLLGRARTRPLVGGVGVTTRI